MAKYNEILVGRYNKLLTKLFSMKGPAAAPQLAGEITPALSLFSGPENRFLEGWNRFMFSQAIGPTAAVPSALRLRNPTNSNVLAVLEQAIMLTVTADPFTKIFHGPIGTDLTTLGILTQARIDPRGNPQPNMIASAAAAAYVSIGVNWNIGNLANTPQFLCFSGNHELPLLPGDAYDFVTNAVNIQAVISWMWRERILEESERQ